MNSGTYLLYNVQQICTLYSISGSFQVFFQVNRTLQTFSVQFLWKHQEKTLATYIQAAQIVPSLNLWWYNRFFKYKVKLSSKSCLCIQKNTKTKRNVHRCDHRLNLLSGTLYSFSYCSAVYLLLFYHLIHVGEGATFIFFHCSAKLPT